jgi:hypothetical protein
MLKSLVSWLERKNRIRTIYRPGSDTEIYLKRYYLWRGKKHSIFLHQFFSSDPEGFHDHPWNSFGIILRKGYMEVTPTEETPGALVARNMAFLGMEPSGTKVNNRKPGFFKFRFAEDNHYIKLKPGTEGKVWTLFMHSERIRPWGFWTEKGWIEAEESAKRL